MYYSYVDSFFSLRLYHQPSSQFLGYSMKICTFCHNDSLLKKNRSEKNLNHSSVPFVNFVFTSLSFLVYSFFLFLKWVLNCFIKKKIETRINKMFQTQEIIKYNLCIWELVDVTADDLVGSAAYLSVILYWYEVYKSLFLNSCWWVKKTVIKLNSNLILQCWP